MGVGGFDKPERGPKVGGPKVGETVDYSKLPPERKAELGDLEALSKETTPEPELSEDDKAKAAEGAEKLAAVKEVLAREDEAEEVDVVEERLEEMAQPTPEDRQQFLRSLLGNETYEKRYEMFGGMLVMTLRDVPPAVEDKLFTELAAAVDRGDIKTDDDWQLWLDRARLASNVSTIRMAKNEAVKCSVGDDPILTQAEERLKLFPTAVMYRAALQTVRVFSRHMEIMLDRALDSDFWEVGGLDSPSGLMSEEQSSTEESQP